MGKEIALLKEKLQKKAEKVVSDLLYSRSMRVQVNKQDDVIPVSIRLAW